MNKKETKKDFLEVMGMLRSMARDNNNVDKGIKSEFKKNCSVPMKLKEIKGRTVPFMAYDFETTPIKAGTPEPLYLTVYGEKGEDKYKLSVPITGKGVDKLKNLGAILENNLLIPENDGTRFIAWNGNGFDAYFIGPALLESGKWIVKPYFTRSKAIRGIKVIENKKVEKGKKRLQFEFLDGIAMTGIVGKKLGQFVETFAPQYPKLKLDLENISFDVNNAYHVEYAERDSEALFYAMKEANRIAKELTGAELQPTIGNLATKYFQSKMPSNILVWRPNDELFDLLHGPLKRGGYCWAQRQFKGKVWKYDINQAYAAAMRECDLPSGRCMQTDEYVTDKCGVYKVRASRKKYSMIPFYWRHAETNKGYFSLGKEIYTWLTNIEINHLKRDGWKVDIENGWVWSESFRMDAMVNELEILRHSDKQGPSGPLGTMVKMIGNASYGKTLEQLDGVDLVMAKEQPDGFHSYMPENECNAMIYEKIGEPLKRAYHQPQIGCFITTYVRLVVREAALKKPGSFLYADTDCVIFDCPADFLDIHPKRYGAWKEERDGKNYLIIAKKVMACFDGDIVEKKAKGMMIKELTEHDYNKWDAGIPPKQKQLQRQNFMKFIQGSDMFIEMERTGTDVNLLQSCKLVGGRFMPISP